MADHALGRAPGRAQPPAAPNSPDVRHRCPAAAARRELLGLLLVAVVSYLVAHRLNGFEWIAGQVRRLERFNVDELLVAALCTSLAACVYAWRRGRDSARLGRRQAHTERALAETSERHRSLFDYHPHSIVSLDLEGRFVATNNESTELTGYASEELAQLTFSDLVLPADLPRVAEAFARAVAREPQQLEASILHKDRRRVPLRLTGLPAVVAGEVVGVYCIAEDVTERDVLENELRRARQVAEDANAAKSLFLANISHEIRTPLTAVLGYAELLGDSHLDPQQRRFLDTMQGSGVRLLRLVDDLLDFARIEAGRVRLEIAPFDLGVLIGHTVAPHAAEARSRGIDLRWTLDPDLPRQVRGDADRVGQVLANLVGNAVKFTDSGWVRVTARAAAGGDAVVLVVRDSGIGISEQDQGRLFQSFTQADGTITRRYGGTGLGLAISSELVSLMGGSLTVRSRPGFGSTFAVTLPLAGAPSRAGEADPHPTLQTVPGLAWT